MFSFLKSKLSSNDNKSIQKHKNDENYYQKSEFIQNCSDASNPFNSNHLDSKLLIKKTQQGNKSDKKDLRKNTNRTDENSSLPKALCCTNSETNSSLNLSSSSSSLLLLIKDENFNVKNINCAEYKCNNFDNNQIRSFKSGWRYKKKSTKVSINSPVTMASSSSSSPSYTSVKMGSKPLPPQPPSPLNHTSPTRVYAVCDCDEVQPHRQFCVKNQHLSIQHLPFQQLHHKNNSINANFNVSTNTFSGTTNAISDYYCNDVVGNSMKFESGDRTRDFVEKEESMHTNEVTTPSTVCTNVGTSNQESTHYNIYVKKTSTPTSNVPTSQARCRPQTVRLEARWRMDGEEGHLMYKENLKRLNSLKRENYLYAPNITITHREQIRYGSASNGKAYKKDV